MIIRVRAIVLYEGKLLAVRLTPYEASTSIGHWCLPGGKVDEGEALVPALEREMVEELGVKPQVGPLLYIQQFEHSKNEHTLEFHFNITNGKDYLNIDLSKTTHGQSEIEEVGFIDPKTSDILPIFLSTEPLAEHAARSGPVKIFSYPNA